MNVVIRGLLPVSLTLLLVVNGCTQPDEGAEGAAVRYLQAAAGRDAATLYELLDPVTRTRIEQLYRTMDRTRDLIVQRFPEADRQAALEAADLVILDRAKTPADLFAALVANAGEQAELTTMQRMGLRPRSVDEHGEGLMITTWGGDTVSVIETEEGWRVSLTAEDRARLEARMSDAERSLTRVRQAVQSLDSRRFGGGS